MAKMHSLKDEPSEPMMGRMLPSFSLSAKDLPEIKEWKVGKKYTLEVEVEMTSQSKNEYMNSDLHASFKIHKIGEKEMYDEAEKQGRKGY